MRETAFPLGVLYPDRNKTICELPRTVFDAAGAESRAELTVTESNARWCPTRDGLSNLGPQAEYPDRAVVPCAASDDEALTCDGASLPLARSNGGVQEGEDRGETCELAACIKRNQELQAIIDGAIHDLHSQFRKGEYAEILADKSHAIQARSSDHCRTLRLASAHGTVRCCLLLSGNGMSKQETLTHTGLVRAGQAKQ